MISIQLACLVLFGVFVVFLYKVQKLHNFEWKKHLSEYITTLVGLTIAVLSELTLVFLLFWYFIWNFNAPCTTTGQTYDCPNNHVFPIANKKTEFWLFFSVLNVVEMIPVFTFLLKNTIFPPHDCFTCFNKDPERRYSIYQYSKEEWSQIVYLQRPLNARTREARALTAIMEEQSQENVPSEANTSNLMYGSRIDATKQDLLVEAIVDDHRVLDKFHNMFTQKDVDRIGGEMTASLVSANNLHYTDDGSEIGSFIENNLEPNELRGTGGFNN